MFADHRKWLTAVRTATNKFTKTAHLLSSSDVSIAGALTTYSLWHIFRAMRMSNSSRISLVDIGSGTGHVLVTAKVMFPEAQVMGIELDPHQFHLGSHACRGTQLLNVCGDARTYDFTRRNLTHAYFFDEGGPSRIVASVWSNVLKVPHLRVIASHWLTPTRADALFPGRLRLVAQVTRLHMRGSGRSYACHVFELAPCSHLDTGAGRPAAASTGQGNLDRSAS